MKRILQYSAVALLTIFFLGLFLWKSNLHDVWRILESTRPGWLLLGLVINWFALVFRTARWRTIISHDQPPPFYPTFFANVVGYALSTILPIRAGDVARPALLARRTNVRFTTALGTVLTERMLDLTSILLLFVTFVAIRGRQFSNDPTTKEWFFVIRAGAIVAGTLLVVIVLFTISLYFFSGHVRRAHEWIGNHIVPRRFRSAWMHFFDSFVKTLELTQHPSALFRVLLFTAGIWFCLTTQFTCVVQALSRPLPFDSSLFITGITTVGSGVPTPGGVGGFHKACQVVLTHFYHFDVDSSVAVAILFHIVGTLPVLLTGLTLAIHQGLNWRELNAEAGEAASNSASGND